MAINATGYSDKTEYILKGKGRRRSYLIIPSMSVNKQLWLLKGDYEYRNSSEI